MDTLKNNELLKLISNDENEIIVKDSKGIEHKCSKLFTFDSDETNLSYICYTENKLDSKGNIIVYAGTYDTSGEDSNIYPIKTQEEWNTIMDTLNEVVKSVKGAVNE